ncbi:unnamed protein product [Rotaria magnacalcarata]|uniref:Phytanoyl-CoA dioxygenase n=4 Tax=Rotaria magnacalcarata TaxID=392030 RepID=A0A815KB55_9BILA|nr:unnamed protein product [Rotaria magnacalcarata]CAF1393402.1 unnamed protein product [Rotaria magnacalcarata]CAF2124244.1 unnamed protein product [Rotaria magnacalcarata]CAF5039932.1 unnamed protein product [Rotaria magnacalcarata]
MASDNIAYCYEHDGFIIIPDLIDGEECEKLKIEAQKLLKEKAHPEASVYVHASVTSPICEKYHKDPRLVNILKKIMPDGIMFLSDKIVVKTSEKTFATPWHIDCFYWPNTRPKLSVWIALDDANADNGTLTVVRGSHKKDWKMINKALPNGEFIYRISDEDINNDDVVVCTVKRGTAIFFPDTLVHGSTSNIAQKDRYTLISTYHAPANDEKFDFDFPAREVLVPTN